jgi:hypothetical protein
LDPACLSYIFVGAGSHSDARRLSATGTTDADADADADAPFAEDLATSRTAVDASFLWQVSTFESRYGPWLGSGGLSPASDAGIPASFADQFV